MSGKVIAIYIAGKGEEHLHSIDSAELVAGKGIVGDRYFAGSGTFSERLIEKDKADWEVTLIEAEEVERFNVGIGSDFGHGEFRRNIITGDIGLNDLVDREFTVGEARLLGMRLCEPCAHLARLTDSRVLPDLVGRAGLRARILTGGVIRPGDGITE